MKPWENVVSDMKLRASYGVNGNLPTGYYGYHGTYTTGAFYNGNPAPWEDAIANPDLTWEKNYALNLGVDLSLFRRVNLTFDWYTRTTKDLLMSKQLNSISGFGSILTNVGEMKNTGFEIEVRSSNIQTKDFSWNTTLSVTWSKEKIEKLPDGDLISENLFVGHSIKSIYGYKYTGIWGTNTPQDILDAYGVKPGFIQIETLEKDGDGGVHKYSTNDRQVLGHTNPDWIVGLNNTFTYKNFDLSVFAMARYGQTINSDLLGYYTAEQSVTTNQLAGADYWTENNQGAYYPAPGTGSEQSTVISALRVRDGSFIKVKNITLGYTFPVNISRKALMEKCRIYATAYNPFIYVKDKQLKGTDPETNGSDAFPTFRQFVFGVNLTF